MFNPKNTSVNVTRNDYDSFIVNGKKFDSKLEAIRYANQNGIRGIKVVTAHYKNGICIGASHSFVHVNNL